MSAHSAMAAGTYLTSNGSSSAVYSESAKEVDALGNALHPNKSAGNAVVAAIFFYYGFYNIAMSPLLASYTAEILPFAIRTKGLVVSSVTVDAALVFNQYLVSFAEVSFLTRGRLMRVSEIAESHCSQSYWLEVLHR